MKSKILCCIVTVLSLLCFSVLQAHNTSMDIQCLLGNWSHAETKEWQYGFFEKFAIYKNDFWTYENVNINKKNARIVLRKGEEKQEISITFTKADSVCIIKNQKGKKQKLIRHTQQPDFIIPDHSNFIDNGYHTDSVTIIGYLRNTQRKDQFEVHVPILLSNEEDCYYSDIDSLGCFRTTIAVINTSAILLDFKPHGVALSTTVEPGETLFLFYDYENGDTRFMGNNARFHQELNAYLKSPYADNWNTNLLRYNALMSHEAYLQKQKAIYKEERNKLAQYLSCHPFVSHKFKMYVQGHLLMNHAFSLMQRKNTLDYNNIINKESFSKSYMDYVGQIYQKLPQPYTLDYRISLFLRDYFSYYNYLYFYNIRLLQIEMLKYLNERNEILLTDSQKSDMNVYEKGTAIKIMSRYYAYLDSVQIEQIIAPYQSAILRTEQLLNDSNIVQLCNRHKEKIPLLQERKEITTDLLCLDSIKVSSILKDFMIAQAVVNSLNQNKKPLQESNIDYFNTLIKNNSIKEIVTKQQNIYTQLNEQNFEYVNSLKSVEHLKENKDVEQLFNQLISPYKGKVIYLDFWGTWCGPCKEELEKVPDIVKAMQNKDVVFMYLASNSPEDTWKNIIKEKKLTGPQYVHYNLPAQQQTLLEKKFSVRAFPTYILINQDGKIVSMKPPRPSQKEELIKELNRFLINE